MKRRSLERLERAAMFVEKTRQVGRAGALTLEELGEWVDAAERCFDGGAYRGRLISDASRMIARIGRALEG